MKNLLETAVGRSLVETLESVVYEYLPKTTTFGAFWDENHYSFRVSFRGQAKGDIIFSAKCFEDHSYADVVRSLEKYACSLSLPNKVVVGVAGKWRKFKRSRAA